MVATGVPRISCKACDAESTVRIRVEEYAKAPIMPAMPWTGRQDATAGNITGEASGELAKVVAKIFVAHGRLSGAQLSRSAISTVQDRIESDFWNHEPSAKPNDWDRQAIGLCEFVGFISTDSEKSSYLVDCVSFGFDVVGHYWFPEKWWPTFIHPDSGPLQEKSGGPPQYSTLLSQAVPTGGRGLSGKVSLKGFIPRLAAQTGMTTLAVYERQRSLTRARLLVGGSQGPGMGAQLSPSAVALLLISILASDSLTESGTRVGVLAAMKPVNKPPYSSWGTLLDTITAILSGSGMAAEIRSIEISRTAYRAIVRFNDPADQLEKDILFEHAKSKEPGIRKSALLSHELLQVIAADVQSALIARLDDFKRTPAARLRRKK